jgi:hypothetical protein
MPATGNLAEISRESTPTVQVKATNTHQATLEQLKLEESVLHLKDALVSHKIAIAQLIAP